MRSDLIHKIRIRQSQILTGPIISLLISVNVVDRPAAWLVVWYLRSEVGARLSSVSRHCSNRTVTFCCRTTPTTAAPCQSSAYCIQEQLSTHNVTHRDFHISTLTMLVWWQEGYSACNMSFSSNYQTFTFGGSWTNLDWLQKWAKCGL